MATCLYAGTTILEIGATSTTFPYHSYTSAVSGATWYYTPWYTKNGYWYSGSSSTSTSGFASTKTVNAGYWLATEKGGTANVQAAAGNCFTVTVAAGANGTASGGGTVLSGGSVSISATPNAHYTFSSWNDGNTTASRTLTNITADATITASFAQSEWRLFAATENSAQGTVSLSGWTTGAWFAAGVTKTATATPKPGYRFLGWYRTGQASPDYTTATASLLMYSENTTYTAKFTSTQFTLTVSAGTGGTVSSSPASGSIVTEGSQVSISATPAYNYTFSSWSGLTGAGAQYTFFMPSANLSTTANFTVRPSFAIALTKENGAYGTIALTSSTAPSVGETAGAINATGYTNVVYTVTATVPDSVHNMFLGWYSGATLVSQELAYTFTQTAATALTLVAKFAQRPSYTLTQRVSDGSVPWVITNSAIVAGCAMAQDRAADFTEPDRWLSGNITITAAPATGWRVAGWSVSNSDGGAGSFQDTTGVNPLTFNLSFNAVAMCVFEKIPVTAACNVHSASSAAGSAEVTFGVEAGESLSLVYGDSAVFSATANANYSFYGWYGSDGVLVSSNASYTHVMTGDLTLTAKFSATVSLTVAHSVAADDTGTVKVNSGTAGSTASASVVLGGTCVIKAIQTSGSIFDSWYLTSDSGFATPLEGYLDEYTITVTGPTALTARFLGVTDLEDRYLLIRNYNSKTSAYDSLIGILAATGGTEIDKEGAGGWDAFYYDPPPGGLSLDPQAAGDRYYKFTGSVASAITAVSNSSLGFMQWKSSYLIPHTAAIENGYTNFAESSPVVIGTVPNISIVTNRHYVLTAVWGNPEAVDVTVRFADGCDTSNGGFTMTPVTAKRETVQGGITDKYLQGSDVVLSAEVENGYVFSGWFYDRAATNLASLETTFTHSVLAPTEFYAKFTQDTDAIYKWEGDTVNKMASWRSKRFMASKPFNPSSARVYADAYPVTLSIFMSSSPDAPSLTEPTVSVYARNQDGFRLPMARPEKYIEIELSSRHDVTEAVISTSMEGLAQ